MNGPRIILADEPTGNLDPKTSEVVYDLFLQLQAARGIAFLIATHNPALARRADRVYRLVEGRAREFDGTVRRGLGVGLDGRLQIRGLVRLVKKKASGCSDRGIY